MKGRREHTKTARKQRTVPIEEETEPISDDESSMEWYEVEHAKHVKYGVTFQAGCPVCDAKSEIDELGPI